MQNDVENMYLIFISLFKVISALLHFVIIDISQFLQCLLQSILILIVEFAIDLADLNFLLVLNLEKDTKLHIT